MLDIVYVSKVRIEREAGPLSRAYLPAESKPLLFGVHGAIARHYGVDPDKTGASHATTIDYLVAATAGCLTGTFGGALEARKISASNGRLTADVTGEIGTEDNVLIIRRIHVVYHLVAPEGSRDIVERVHRTHARSCPVYLSLHKAIQITTEYRLEGQGL